MNCDKYCQGRSTEVDCVSYSGDSKDECIKACLDCRSPNKKYCYCPSIFPPKGTSDGREGDENQFTADKTSSSDDSSDDTVFWSCIIAAIIVIAICFLIFCWMRYKKRTQSSESNPPMEGPTQVGT